MMAVVRSIELRQSLRSWEMTDFAQRLLAWFEVHGRRDLPWQEDVTAYRVWVSEIMLQQTQVSTVIPYFNKFVSRFSDMASLAGAHQDDVLRHWSGLGYYARARNLHKAAQIVCDKYAGVFPAQFEDVVALPGIGRSTAGAILALATGQRHAILDGNVKRVLARHALIEGWPGKTSVATKLWVAADMNTPESRVAEYTQAIMDLGATVCTQNNALCNACPVNGDCGALAADVVSDFPGRRPGKPKPLRHTTMILASVDGCVFLQRRPEAGIWGGLWSLPELGERSLQDWCGDVLRAGVDSSDSWEVVRHSFSHYELDIQPIVVRIAARPGKVADADGETWHRLEDVPPGGIAAPVKKLIDQLKRIENAAHR